ncbi:MULTISPECIES: fused MFS/spermidine synthase [Colwellia]|uniref:Putative membrane protein n=1 Tax=Colwellia psychrerythraea (strain 34H / ATCC BAA-681) TaxID=167879 RepID=Q47W51_COLP3|nr:MULTISPECIES: fused MFS/spermidine synthase [Colwellia]AAZ26904.1 putative membrane protein [Colwellia psychrerythraea 34H]PKH85495.1 glycosyl transferase [Colwellia sp. Bg11-28]
MQESKNSINYNNLFIYFLAFTSGFSIMCIELLAGRILAPFFGSSVHIWGSIITVFMLSLALGYLFGGKLSTRSASLTRYGAIFIIAGLTLLPIVTSSTWLMESIFLAIEDSRYGSLLASTALFFIPTIILGMLSPYSVRLLVRNSNESGQVAGKLYFVSTLGSAIGTIITSFYLVLWFDIDTIVVSISLLLSLLGFITIVVAKANENLFKSKAQRDISHA